MKNTKFKVGDLVVRIIANYGNEVKKGGVYQVTEIITSNPHGYAAGYGIKIKGWYTTLNPDYFEPHKESKVLEILRTYDKIRSSKGQGTTQVDS